MKIFVTGDTHGNFERFCPEYFPESRALIRKEKAARERKAESPLFPLRPSDRIASGGMAKLKQMCYN